MLEKTCSAIRTIVILTEARLRCHSRLDFNEYSEIVRVISKHTICHVMRIPQTMSPIINNVMSTELSESQFKFAPINWLKLQLEGTNLSSSRE